MARPDLYRLVNGVIEIPVVVNVLYKTNAENISASQIQSQIAVLNEEQSNEVLKLIDNLEQDDDVQKVYHNLK